MLDQIAKRASVRQFTDQPVERAKTEELLRAAMAAPSAGNQQPWEFYVAADATLRAKLAASSPYAKPVLAAPIVIVACQRTEGVRFPECVQQDMAASVENLLIECVNQELGAVWMAVAPFDERIAAVRAALNMSGALEPFALIAIGYPANAVEAQGPKRFDAARVHYCE